MEETPAGRHAPVGELFVAREGYIDHFGIFPAETGELTLQVLAFRIARRQLPAVLRDRDKFYVDDGLAAAV